MAERTRLAEELERWLHRQRVSKAHVAKHGGVSGNTIWLIQQGTTSQPEIETLRKIARGLATDPFSRELDRALYAEAWQNLALASGLPDPTLEMGSPVGLAESIRPAVRSLEVAELWADIIRDNPNATPDQLSLLRTLYEAIVRQRTPHVGGQTDPHKGSAP